MDENFKQFQKIKVTPSPEKISKIREEYLKLLNVLRFDYIEEIPSKRLRPEMPNYQRYKCRTVFFSNVLGVIMVLNTHELINNPEVKKQCEEFSRFCDTLRGTERFYTEEDVDIANRMLDSLIAELSPVK
ncbi:hypothetical protein A2738_01085 [Candidatus Nomurabacteria bacterium RIFCSPHIGHO2_01_FULL_42_15]|uniref:Uncharacterized protein n=1 Tax=Candidatus Nomurabacteria bacterium RIFCSPHIGHO2_01_FULL_42_15 TaxID=1801742 RepID=A0A1F6VFM6_9BACT|nr:MAG: hypothetical protein A2738_01085 [Candidatus Nomurabacteria bacterium RIFCSPHIGHO2_01_FULL_42_15]OGI93114.1 MAG: hypothetical protein A3A99_01085 [Candidatus Nomurabacteria bacterium RIFCSPLOWO2_01_FULL_41_18]